MARRPALIVAWLVAALTWGASFLFIKVGLEGLSPGQVTFARVLFGAIFLGCWLVVTRTRPPRDRVTWGHFAVLGFLFCFVPFNLFAWAETQVSSGMASILNATTPLWTMGLVVAFLPSETITVRRAVGLLVGFAGVVIVALPQVTGADGGDALVGQLACLGATACYGVGLVWLRRFVVPRGVSPVTIAFGQVVCGLGWSVLAAPLLSTGEIRLTLPVVLAMLALGSLGTGLAFVLGNAVTAGLGPTFSSTVTYLSPLIGVALGAMVLGEVVTPNQVIGAAVVVLGIAVGQGVLRPPWRRGRADPGGPVGVEPGRADRAAAPGPVGERAS
ncbi:MAG: putative rane protein, partial [Actinotalea sp.]|nr:putative rane protein [Actinotalea sp.]